MERVTITIETENAAFGESDYEAEQEVARILATIADSARRKDTALL